MEKSVLDRFRGLLKEHKNTIVEWFNSVPEEKKAQLCCDPGCSIDTIVQKHDEALHRIETGEFGECKYCKDGVEIERLEIDFTTQVCLGHFSEAELKVLERDLELAAKVQKQLLPSSLPALKGIQLAAHTEPAKIVSGDYFDFFSYTNGAQGIAVADVMGKGLPASMLMSNLQASLRILGPDYHDLDKLAVRLNELFRYNLKLISFITLFLLKIDTEKKAIQYCNAGHNPAIYWDAKKKELKRLRPTGPAIGLIPNAVYGADNLQYSEGDVLLIFTDGVSEARNSNEEEFGEKRLENYLIENLDKPAEVIVSDLRRQAKQFAGMLQDDVTLISVKF